jgi:hypothetical protein
MHSVAIIGEILERFQILNCDVADRFNRQLPGASYTTARNDELSRCAPNQMARSARWASPLTGFTWSRAGETVNVALKFGSIAPQMNPNRIYDRITTLLTRAFRRQAQVSASGA